MNVESLNKRYAYVYKTGGHPIYEAHQMISDKPLRCNALDDKWQAAINSQKWWASGYTGIERGREQDHAVIKKILTFGGYEVCMAYMDEDADKILSRGQLWYGDKFLLMKGEPSQCHRNTCDLWEENIKDHEVAIATGYALSPDGMWRQHSWLMHRRYRSVEVVETTVKRVAYFGYVMTHDEALSFCEENL